MVNMSKESAARFLAQVQDNVRFFCKDGQAFDSIEKLDESLKKMSKETFEFHVNSQKNDFSNWIYDIIGDVTLADSLRKAKDKKKVMKIISSRITELRKLV